MLEGLLYVTATETVPKGIRPGITLGGVTGFADI